MQRRSGSGRGVVPGRRRDKEAVEYFRQLFERPKVQGSPVVKDGCGLAELAEATVAQGMSQGQFMLYRSVIDASGQSRKTQWGGQSVFQARVSQELRGTLVPWSMARSWPRTMEEF